MPLNLSVVSASQFHWYNGCNRSVIKTNSAEKLRVTSAGNIGIGTSIPTALFHLKDGHLKSEQTTAPTVVATTANGITGVTLTAGSTDTKGNLTTTGGTSNNSSVCTLTITFNKIYTVAPIVIITGNGVDALNCNYYVSSTTTNFTLTFRSSTNGVAPSFNYMVIE